MPLLHWLRQGHEYRSAYEPQIYVKPITRAHHVRAAPEAASRTPFRTDACKISLAQLFDYFFLVFIPSNNIGLFS